MMTPYLSLLAEAAGASGQNLLPEEFKKNLSFGILIIIAIAAVFCIIKCIQGADMIDRGEDGKKKIFSGIAIGMAPWLGIAAFRATGVWDRLGITVGTSGTIEVPANLKAAIQLSVWAIVGIASIWCIAKCIDGANQLERGESGKKKIFSGLAIAAAPWIAIGALNVTGIWSALNIELL